MTTYSEPGRDETRVLRKVSADGASIPVKDRLVAFIVVEPDGSVWQPWGIGGKREAVELAKRGKARLFIAWPGQHSTHVFEADALELIERKLA